MEYALWYYEHSFTPSQVHDLAAAFERALLSSVALTNAKIRDVDLLSEDHLHWLQLRNEVLPETRQVCIHEAIEPFFLSTPSAQAVCAWDGDFSYAELDQLSFSLSRVLTHRGVKPETYVTIHCEKSRWTSVAMLAVLRAGGAFTLLDPSLPLAHKQTICSDLGCQIMISSKTAEDASSLVREMIMIGDGEDESWVVPPSEPIRSSQAKPTHAAYAVFTSGSTGKPKGVVIDHSSFCTSAMAQHQSLSIDSSTRVLQFSAYTWDVSIMDQLATFMAGACVCIPSESQRVNALAEAIQQYGATWIQTTPPVVRLLEPTQVPSLQTIILIGETPSYDDIKMWQGRVSLRETFGPTECSVLALVNPDLSSDPRNIGRESGCICWIVDPDDHNKLVAVGAIGELLIEGPILGRGYLNDPLKTSAAFIENPSWAERFRDNQSVRLYKTGDLVHYCPDGSIRFFRRKDTQVKLRGQRIEPGEVEHHISNSFDGAERVVVDVLALESEASRSFLVAFVKPASLNDNDADIDADLFAPPSTAFSVQVALTQARLQNQLPKHMVPTIFLPLNFVPLTSSCKTDRRMLKRRAAALTRSELETYMHAGASVKQTPTTEMEQKLHPLWAKVLNLATEMIGTNDDFFHLGGDSISAMQLVFQCRRVGISIGMEDVFRHRTLAGIATHARNEKNSADALAVEKLDEPFPLSSSQQLFFHFSPHGFDDFNYCSVMKITRKIEAERLRRAIKTIVERHSMLRSRFSQDCDGSWMQRITSQTEGSYRFQHSIISGENEITQVLQSAQECVNIQHGPLLVADHLQPGGQKGDYLILVVHRLVADLASWHIILGDLETVLSQKTPIPAFAPVPTSFQAWCSLDADSKARRHLTGNKLLPHSGEQVPMVCPLEFWGMTGRPNQVKHSNTTTFTIDHSTTNLLLGRANQAFQTQPAEILHAALVHSFIQTFAERNAPIMYNEGYSRQPADKSIDTSNTVGLFATLHPTLVNVDNCQDLVEMVRRTKDAHRSATPNDWARLSSLCKDSRYSESILPTPVEIVFNFEGVKEQLENNNSILQIIRSPYTEHQETNIASEAPRFALINVSAVVVEGELMAYFTFNEQMKHKVLLKDWVDEYQKSIIRAVMGLSHASPAYTLSDFPLLRTTYEDLDAFVAKVRDQIGLQEGENSAIIENAYPCSPIQRGILLSKSKNNDLYSPRFTWKLQVAGQNSIDLSRLREAWKSVLDRHPVFRTVFVQSSSHMEYYNQAVMVSLPDNITTLQYDDEDVMELVRDYRATRLHRDQNALWHLILCQSKRGDTFCDLKVSHALIDGTSMAVLTREVQLAYDEMLSAGAGPPYSDYIRYLQSTPVDTVIDYWKKKLSAISPCMFPRISSQSRPPSTSNIKRELCSVELEIEDASIIYQFCRQHGFTISNILQVAWALILRCYTTSKSVCFAYVTSGRDAPVSNIEGAVGPFINVLINHMLLDSDMPLLDVLRVNQDDNVDNLKYQNCSLAEIFHAMSIGAAELFNSSMSVQNRTSDYDSSGASFEFSVVNGEDRTEVKYRNPFACYAVYVILTFINLV